MKIDVIIRENNREHQQEYFEEVRKDFEEWTEEILNDFKETFYL
jgi:hypothetical protein